MLCQFKLRRPSQLIEGFTNNIIEGLRWTRPLTKNLHPLCARNARGMTSSLKHLTSLRDVTAHHSPTSGDQGRCTQYMSSPNLQAKSTVYEEEISDLERAVPGVGEQQVSPARRKLDRRHLNIAQTAYRAQDIQTHHVPGVLQSAMPERILHEGRLQICAA